MKSIEIGRLLRGSTSGFVAGCRVASFESDAPSLGALVRAPLGPEIQVYGLIHDIHIDDDGLVRQLVTAEGVDEAAIADNRQNRTVPVEISVLAVGTQQNGRIVHLLPPRPPLSLDIIHLCDDDELCRFTSAGHFGYFRHLLRDRNLPVSEILAAHIQQAQRAHAATGNPDWVKRASQELITLLRDDYTTLMNVLNALGDTSLF
jgi:hypothetical protein